MYTFHSRVFLIFEKNYFSKTEEMVKRTFCSEEGDLPRKCCHMDWVGAKDTGDRASWNSFLEKGSVCSQKLCNVHKIY